MAGGERHPSSCRWARLSVAGCPCSLMVSLPRRAKGLAARATATNCPYVHFKLRSMNRTTQINGVIMTLADALEYDRK